MYNYKATKKILIIALILLQLNNYKLLRPETLSSGHNISERATRHDKNVPLITENISGIEMVFISGNEVTPFWISRYEVTQEIYQSLMGKNPSFFRGESLPVEQVSWFDAVEFCNRLSLKSGLNPCYIIDKSGDDPDSVEGEKRWHVSVYKYADGFRLPTSAEWVTAARGGTESSYFWGDEMDGSYCWYRYNSGGRTHPVGEKKPNPVGIYDIAGNVREWCFDWHPSFVNLKRTVHDGHYNMDGLDMMPEAAEGYAPGFGIGFIGIRLVKNK